MSVDPAVYAAIVQIANRHGLDPAAVLAVAAGEGGIRYGAVGDNGTSFGPFQLHVGGALPADKDAAWANSPEGLDYAIRKMAEVGARGLTGAPAIDTIVRKFERPYDPDSSVRNAVGRYSQYANGAAPGVLPQGGSSVAPGRSVAPGGLAQAAAAKPAAPAVDPTLRPKFTASLIDSIGKPGMGVAELLQMANQLRKGNV